MYGGPPSYQRRRRQPVRRYGPIHILLPVKRDNEERWEPACGLWGQQYRKLDNGDLECLACIKRLP